MCLGGTAGVGVPINEHSGVAVRSSLEVPLVAAAIDEHDPRILSSRLLFYWTF